MHMKFGRISKELIMLIQRFEWFGRSLVESESTRSFELGEARQGAELWRSIDVDGTGEIDIDEFASGKLTGSEASQRAPCYVFCSRSTTRSR